MMGKKSKLFNTQSFLLNLSAGKTIVHYPTGSEIFTQGALADAVFYIQKGRVKLTAVSPKGKEAIIAVMNDGEFLGEGCIAGQSHRISSAITIGKCAIFRFEKRVIMKALRTQPKFSEFFITYLLSRYIRSEDDLIDRIFSSGEKRLARILLFLAQLGKEGKPERVIPRISQDILAQMVGTTRSRVSQFMTKFRELGLVQYDEGLVINSSLLHLLLHE